MEKSYLNKVDELFQKDDDICVQIMNEIVNNYPRFDYNFIPWCPMAYGPRIGYMDRKTDDIICVMPDCILYKINGQQGRIEIESLSVEEVMKLVKEQIND